MRARDQKLSSTSSDIQELTVGMRTVGMAIWEVYGLESGEEIRTIGETGENKVRY